MEPFLLEMIVVFSFPFHIPAKCTTSYLLCPEIEPDFSNKYVVLNNLGIVYKKKQMPNKDLGYFLQTLQLVSDVYGIFLTNMLTYVNISYKR